MSSPSPHAEPHTVGAMRLSELLQVAAIERACFSEPWSLHSFVGEFLNAQSRRLVIRASDPPRVVAYAVLWLGGGELHVNNIAVHPAWRRKRLAERLLEEAFRTAEAASIREVYLEVRPSNRGALGLYRKLGFREVGVRKAYYADNGEDATVLRLDLEGPVRRAAGAGADGREGAR